MSASGRIALAAATALVFFLINAPLLTDDGVVRGFTSDAAIIGLMGKKMLEGRGFDVFFWGQNYVGPFTSMMAALFGAILGTVDPLALRLGAFTETLAAILLIAFGVARIDVRAGVATAVALALTPPVILRPLLTSLGAEMGLFFSAALLAMLLQHVTSERGWLSQRGGQLAFGALAGIGWWMNQQVVFTLAAGAIVLALRRELLPLLPRAAIGYAIGYAPVWLGGMLGWYEQSYVYAPRFSLQAQRIVEFPRMLQHWAAVADEPWAALHAIALCVFLIAAWRRDHAHLLLGLIVLGNLGLYLVAGGRPHYFITSVGPLLALAALGAVRLFARARVVVVAAAIVNMLSIAVSSQAIRRDTLAQPDPRVLLQEVRDARCAVCYADFWIAYRYRFLDGEQRAWIPYLTQNRTREESKRMQRLRGQRCLVRNDGITKLDRDLPLSFPRPRRVSRPARPSA